jgi:hypothetical protein
MTGTYIKCCKYSCQVTTAPQPVRHTLHIADCSEARDSSVGCNVCILPFCPLVNPLVTRLMPIASSECCWESKGLLSETHCLQVYRTCCSLILVYSTRSPYPSIYMYSTYIHIYTKSILLSLSKYYILTNDDTYVQSIAKKNNSLSIYVH